MSCDYCGEHLMLPLPISFSGLTSGQVGGLDSNLQHLGGRAPNPSELHLSVNVQALVVVVVVVAAAVDVI